MLGQTWNLCEISRRVVLGIALTVAPCCDQADPDVRWTVQDERPSAPRRLSRRERIMEQIQREERLRVPEPIERMSPDVLRDFDSVVEVAAASTASVRDGDGNQIALATVISEDGYLITKASVLAEADSLSVQVGQQELSAERVGEDLQFDVALLRVQPEQPLVPVAWSRGALQAGQLIAAPSPAGDESETLSAGVVSVAPRKLRQKQAFLGVRPMDHPRGVLVEEVIRGTTAEDAGIKPGDVIVRLGDQTISNVTELLASLEAFQPGEPTVIEYLREDQTRRVTSSMGSRDLGLHRMQRFEVMNSMGGKLSAVRNGFPVVLEHDMLIYPDECGGPIVDLSGQVIGINIARAGRTKTYAIPAEDLESIIKALQSDAVHAVSSS